MENFSCHDAHCRVTVEHFNLECSPVWNLEDITLVLDNIMITDR